MSVDGKWSLRIESDDIDPEIMPRDVKATIKSAGGALSGSMEGPYPLGQGVTIDSGAISGDSVKWAAVMRGEKLRPQELEFSGTLAGDRISGEVEVGIFGTASFVATRN